MILYNVTTKVDWSIHDEWVHWMKEYNIPGIMNSGFFVEYKMVRLLQVDELDGPTYAVQYFTESMEQYNMYVEQGMALQYKKESDRWGDKFISFSTIMEVVQ